MKQDFQWNFLVKIACFFGIFLWPVSLNGAHLGTGWVSKLSSTVENADATSGRKELVPHEHL